MTVTFGGWLKQWRKELGITQEDLAERINCSLGALRKLEADERRPSGQLASLIAGYLRIPPAEHEAFITFARTGQGAPSSGEGISSSDTPWRATYRHPTNLPAVLTALVGREQEQSAARGHLLNTKVRLLTL